MSKKLEKCIILGGIVVIVIVAAYFEIIKPATFSVGGIECGKNKNVYLYISNISKDALYLDAFDGKLPSKDFNDYRLVGTSINICNRSFLKLQSANFVIDPRKAEESDNIIYYLGYGELDDGETEPDNFVTKEMTAAFYLYVGDLKSDDEIEKRILDIIHQTEFKITYNMEFVGFQEAKFEIPEEFNEVKFSTSPGGK